MIFNTNQLSIFLRSDSKVTDNGLSFDCSRRKIIKEAEMEPGYISLDQALTGFRRNGNKKEISVRFATLAKPVWKSVFAKQVAYDHAGHGATVAGGPHFEQFRRVRRNQKGGTFVSARKIVPFNNTRTMPNNFSFSGTITGKTVVCEAHQTFSQAKFSSVPSFSIPEIV